MEDISNSNIDRETPVVVNTDCVDTGIDVSEPNSSYQATDTVSTGDNVMDRNSLQNKNIRFNNCFISKLSELSDAEIDGKSADKLSFDINLYRDNNIVPSHALVRIQAEQKTKEDSFSPNEGGSMYDEDKNTADSISLSKTDCVRLLQDVKRFYPEIEFSKTSSNIIQEGKAYIIKQTKNVFYNPVQEFNRDLSVLAISVFSEEHENDPRCQLQAGGRGTKRKAEDKLPENYNINNDNCHPTVGDDKDQNIPLETGFVRTGRRLADVKCDDGIVILEALSATGLRSIRYAKEVAGVKEIVANDISIAAVESIKNNIEYNSVGNLVTTSHNDASLLMYSRKAQGNFFDVVDLDPYGCPSRFLDAAVQCVRDGGLLLVTCTDMAVLAGNSPETCYVKYGAVSLRNTACHEMALRIALQCIESHATRYGRYIVPQLSFSADFYIRVIVKVYTSPSMCKKTTSKLSMVYQCVGCQSLVYWPLGLTENCGKNSSLVKYQLARGPPVAQECVHCTSSYYQGGPIWSGPLHNTSFVEKMLSKMRSDGSIDFVTKKRMEGMLELIREELVTCLLYYTIDSLCSKVHCEVIPRAKFVSAILHGGYNVTLSHAAPNSVKTNAPSSVIWDIIRCWVQQHPVNKKRLDPGSVAERLLSAIPKFIANFDLHPQVMPRNQRKLLRYQQNPQPFWGPGTRDKNNCRSEEDDENNIMNKSYMNQNKKHKKEREMKEQMKATINSKNIDIIEVVTLTDDDDDDDDDNDDNHDAAKKEKECYYNLASTNEKREGAGGIYCTNKKTDDGYKKTSFKDLTCGKDNATESCEKHICPISNKNKKRTHSTECSDDSNKLDPSLSVSMGDDNLKGDDNNCLDSEQCNTNTNDCVPTNNNNSNR